jgi:hypothetical protein
MSLLRSADASNTGSMATVPDRSCPGKHLFDLFLDDVHAFVVGYACTTNERSKERVMAAIAWDRIEERTRERQAQREPLRLVTATTPPSRRQPSAAVYRRRRLVALVVVLAVVLVAVQLLTHVASASASAGAAPAEPVVLVAQPGDSYWTLAAEVYDGGDLRSTVDALVRANGGGDLRAGDRIVLGG